MYLSTAKLHGVGSNLSTQRTEAPIYVAGKLETPFSLEKNLCVCIFVDLCTLFALS